MGRRSLFFAVAFLALGCDNHLQVVDDTEQAMSELASALRRVTDEASMKAAEPKLEAIAKKMERLAQRARSLGQPPQSLQEALEARTAKIAETQKSLLEEVSRVQKLPGGTQLFEDLKRAAPSQGNAVFQMSKKATSGSDPAAER